MPQARMNRRQIQRDKKRNRFGYWAPAVGQAYPGKPVHNSDKQAIKLMLKSVAARDPAVGTMETQAIHRTIDAMSDAEVRAVLTANGFKQVKRKELISERANVSSRARLHPGQAAKPGGVSEVEYITRLA